MTNYEEIIINWTPAVEVEKLSETEVNLNNTLYQIYGDSHIYGRDVLLYIGKATNAGVRIGQHLKGVFGYVNNLKISVGTIADYTGKLEVPESILIANHKPSFNKEYIHDLDPAAKINKIIILNNGTKNMLTACCTNFWWVD